MANPATVVWLFSAQLFFSPIPYSVVQNPHGKTEAKKMTQGRSAALIGKSQYKI
jgi:hypothetical protein